MNSYLYLRACVRAFNKQLITKAVAILLFTLAFSFGASAHKTPELVWKNPVLYSGVAGADGAVYRFPKVDSDIDALVKIVKRSSPLVKLVSMDLTNSGWDKAWQPQITYNNNTAPGPADWYMEFEITFVNKGTVTNAVVEGFDVTALDIDGNGDKIREYVSFYNQKSYLTEANTLLSGLNLLDDILGLLGGVVGRRFDGPTLNFTNIDTSGTSVMVTNTYEDKNKFKIRTGGVATAANGASDRMYSLYFKGFDYQKPATLMLPVSVINWNAALNNNNVDLKWTTTFERNSSHFVIERSTDGAEYTDAAMIFTAGNSEISRNYSFTDKLASGSKGMVYYRLKAVDLDGKETISTVKVVRIGKAAAEVKIIAYPNPVVNDVRITIPQQWQNKTVNYQLMNSNGQNIKAFTIQNASQTEVIQMSQVPAGIYMVKVSNGSETTTQAIVKSKN